jgi:ribosomal protein S18 acetylase RimI-like enzyme
VPIRPRQPADLDACVAVLRRVHERSGYPARWPADPAGWLTPAGQLAAWVAEHNGAIAGQVGLSRGQRHPDLLQATGQPPGQLGEIIRLFVDPAVRGAGLGRQLLAAASAHAVASGLRPVLEVVDDAGPAIALYERSGWRQVGSGTATWANPDGRHPGLLYYVSPEP